jgi:FAD-dependent urate hydroxylase
VAVIQSACVIGAGLAGLSLAVAWPKGVELTVIERKASVEPLGGGLILQPNAVHALQEIDCLEMVRKRGVELTRLVQHRDGVPVEISLRDVWPRLGLPTLAVHRHAIQEVLLDRAVPHISLELSQEAVDIRVARDGPQVVRTADGRERAFDLVIAADGIDSQTRARLAPSVRVRDLDLWWARWLVNPGGPIARDWQTERAGGAAIGSFPLGGDAMQVFATIPAGEMGGSRTDATLARLVDTAPVLRRAAAHGMHLVHVGPAREVRPHVWSGVGVAFVGDAAHAMPPTLSAGGGLAIEDGVVLGRLLGSAADIATVQERYERLRLRRLAWMAKVGRIQVSTVHGSPVPPSSVRLAGQMRSMYEPLDDPDYLSEVAA